MPISQLKKSYQNALRRIEIAGIMFFYDDKNHIATSLLDECDGQYYSLMLIRPEKLALRRSEKGKLLATFEYNGNIYRNIRVTDMEMDQSSNFPAGKTLYANSPQILVMSLGEDFFNPNTGITENWKFVASIIDEGNIEKRWTTENVTSTMTDDVQKQKRLDVNEIIIKAEQVPGRAGFYNYEELKQYFQEGLLAYNNTRYSLDNIEQAQQDLEVLKAVRKKLTTKRKELESSYILPIREVLQQMDELIDMVKEPYRVIDTMLKNNAKAIKEREIRRYAYNKSEQLGEYAVSVIESNAFFNPRWRNISYKEKAWKEDVDLIITKAKSDIDTIVKDAGKYKPAALAYYLDHLSMDGMQTFIENLKKVVPQDEQRSPEIPQRTIELATDPIEEKGNNDTLNSPKTESENTKDKVKKATISLVGKERDIDSYIETATSFAIEIRKIDLIDLE